jgi:predicted Fe-Mo cluster-binding NifX family protein
LLLPITVTRLDRRPEITGKGEISMTRIAIPLRQGSFSEHFGGAEEFAFYTVDDETKSVSQRRLMSPPEHGRGVYPLWLREVGAEVIIAGGMGPRAVGMLADHGIQVVLGVRGSDPDQMVERFLTGNLESTGNVCQDHGFHDCGHHER